MSGSVSGSLTAIDVQRLPRDERGPLEIENPIDDISDLAHTTKGVQPTQLRIGQRIVRGSLDDAERDRVNPQSARRVLDGQRTGHSDEPAFGKGRQRRGSVLSA